MIICKHFTQSYSVKSKKSLCYSFLFLFLLVLMHNGVQILVQLRENMGATHGNCWLFVLACLDGQAFDHF